MLLIELLGVTTLFFIILFIALYYAGVLTIKITYDKDK